MFEHARFVLSSKWPEDFGLPSVTQPEKSLDEMSKEEYKTYTERLKKEKDSVSSGYNKSH